MIDVLVPLADGFEEVEAVTVIDVLRRANLKVMTAGLYHHLVTGSHGITLRAECCLAEVYDRSFEALVLPSGVPGTARLMACQPILNRIQKMDQVGHCLAAIGAATMVLAKAGVLNGRKATSYPGALDEFSAVQCHETAVIVDGHLVTASGPGVAKEFALTLIERLLDKEARDRVEIPLNCLPTIAETKPQLIKVN